MDNFRFYPTLTDDMTEKSGCSVEKYSFSYTSGEWEYELNQKGRSTIKLTDPSEIWKIENDGLRLEKKISIAYPNFLFGKDGIVCADAELGICIIWTNKTLTQTGCIMPVSLFTCMILTKSVSSFTRSKTCSADTLPSGRGFI